MRAPVLEVGPAVTDREWAEEWSDQLENLRVEMCRACPKADLRRRAAACVRGLLGPVSRKNGWQPAEYLGEAHAWGQQHLLSRAVWDADELRDSMRGYVLDGLAGLGAGPGGAGVVVIDETRPRRRDRRAGRRERPAGLLGTMGDRPPPPRRTR